MGYTCRGCGLTIRDGVVLQCDENGETYHPNCFRCLICLTVLANRDYYYKNSSLYCRRHYLQRFASKCVCCEGPIGERGVKAHGRTYHESCFKCQKCYQPIRESGFMIVKERRLCMKCVVKNVDFDMAIMTAMNLEGRDEGMNMYESPPSTKSQLSPVLPPAPLKLRSFMPIDEEGKPRDFELVNRGQRRRPYNPTPREKAHCCTCV